MSNLLLGIGLLGVLAGVLTAIRSPGRHRWRRPAGVLLAAAGAALALVGYTRSDPPPTSADSYRLVNEFLPTFEVREIHGIRIHAPPERVFRAIRSVTPADVRFLRALFWLRRLPAHLTGAPLPPLATDEPFLAPGRGSTTVILGETPERELVLGLVGQFWRLRSSEVPPGLADAAAFLAFDRPGYAKSTLSFHVEDEGHGWCRLTTETRVVTTDSRSRRRFAWYWRVIGPGSALLRRTFLRAVKDLAEA